jgi:antitoxin component YwqK of YwqJK toxin-antitoxin module
MSGCRTSQPISETPTYPKQFSAVNYFKEIIKVEYYANNSLKRLFMVDFEFNYSLYMEKSNSGATICKGGFDVSTYDSTKIYNETVWYQGLERDGTFGGDEHNFHLMKNGTWFYYYTNGNLQMSGEYFKNMRNGAWNFYAPSSDLELIRLYNNGEIIKDSIVTKGLYIIPPK